MLLVLLLLLLLWMIIVKFFFHILFTGNVTIIIWMILEIFSLEGITIVERVWFRCLWCRCRRCCRKREVIILISNTSPIISGIASIKVFVAPSKQFFQLGLLILSIVAIIVAALSTASRIPISSIHTSPNHFTSTFLISLIHPGQKTFVAPLAFVVVIVTKINIGQFGIVRLHNLFQFCNPTTAHPGHGSHRTRCSQHSCRSGLAHNAIASVFIHEWVGRGFGHAIVLIWIAIVIIVVSSITSGGISSLGDKRIGVLKWISIVIIVVEIAVIGWSPSSGSLRRGPLRRGPSLHTTLHSWHVGIASTVINHVGRPPNSHHFIVIIHGKFNGIRNPIISVVVVIASCSGGQFFEEAWHHD
mmetsp:Transcript_5085/g.10376  ORF Transcript_5085/g.10376 Transcript_5085/m.10376 type:complete len:358 (+) Transcript_5085:3887-4960(+)